MDDKPFKLTSYPIGSLREVWSIAWPLMLGLLSSSIMIVVDRLFLARCSLNYMNAAATSGTAAYAFFILPMIVAGISGVFVGQFHGSDNNNNIGVAVWQMIWFSVLLTPIFLVIAIFLPKYLFYGLSNNFLETSYFFYLVIFGSFYCLSQALIGFFSGQGRVVIIAVATLISNVVNIIFDVILIFGVKGIISPLGVTGAAIATSIAQVALFVFLFLFFLSPQKRKKLGTGLWRFNRKIFVGCLKIGFPASIAHTSEYFSHFIFFRIMNLAGAEYITIVVLIQTIYIFIFFVVEGLSKAVTAICSNFIGAHKYYFVGKNLIASYKLHFIFFCLVLLTFLFFSLDIFSIFCSSDSKEFLSNAVFASRLYKSSIWLCVFMLFDGWAMASVGMLTAAGDTKFIMVVGMIAPWILYLVPVSIGLKYFNIMPDDVWIWICVYGVVNFLIYWWRYRSQRWKKISICDQ
jgi:multidrug resistance protein, MATE family